MRYAIPEIGDIIELLEDWTFTLCNTDRRNESMYKACAPAAEEKYEVPEWMRNVNWRNATYDSKNPVFLPCTDIRVVYVHGRPARQPSWFGRRRHVFTKPYTETSLDSCGHRIEYKACDLLCEQVKKAEKTLDCTVPKGAVLRVDRVYIRQGVPRLSSVTFRYPEKKARFFAPMPDVLRMEFTPKGHKQMYAGRSFGSFGG